MITYKDAGVDIEKSDRFVKSIKSVLNRIKDNNVISGIGSFSALYKLESLGCDMILSSTTDGVGTKLSVAQMIGQHNTIGIDLVAMNVNDIITNGSNPIFFLDYIAYSKLNDSIMLNIIEGIEYGLRLSNCALVGGETAQLPGFYKPQEYDLAGFCVGIVKKNELLTNGCTVGDTIIGISSSGFHSNGYSLLRKVFFDIAKLNIDSIIDGYNISEILIEPTNIYVNIIQKIKNKIKALAHITGGGFYSNIPRILKENQIAIIEKHSYEVPDIFKIVQDMGHIEEKEMYRVFNMGIGMITVLDNKNVQHVIQNINKSGFKAYKIGYIDKGKKGIRFV